MEIKTWNSGLDGYKKCTLTDDEFITELVDCEFIPGRKISEIFTDFIGNQKSVDVLFSGGMDSELVLLGLIDAKIKFNVITMVIMVDGCIMNTHDLYYSEKFCRENNLIQKKIIFHADKFFLNGEHLNYLLSYRIQEPHVASHFWLIEQCNFPIMCGDYPWVQTHKPEKVLSPFRLNYSCYDLFMKDRGISGIGNMLNHSYELSYKFIEFQLDIPPEIDKVHLIKNYLYKIMYPNIEPRLRSYGWESIPKNILNIVEHKIGLIRRTGPIGSKIKWGKNISRLLNTLLLENTFFS